MTFFPRLRTWLFGPVVTEQVLRVAVADLWKEFNKQHKCPPYMICLPPTWFWAAVKYAKQCNNHLTNVRPLRTSEFIWFHGMRVQSNFCDQARCENDNLMLWADLDPGTGQIVAEHAGLRRHTRTLRVVVDES